jgi:hypothetical protein
MWNLLCQVMQVDNWGRFAEKGPGRRLLPLQRSSFAVTCEDPPMPMRTVKWPFCIKLSQAMQMTRSISWETFT